MLRILLVDDHSLFRSGLRGLLEASGQCEVVGEAANGSEFIALLPAARPDIVLMDIDMPLMNGFEATSRALALVPDLRIITLSMHGDGEYYYRMVEQGVKGFLLKSSSLDEVLAAIRIVAEGNTYFSQDLLRSLVDGFRPEPAEAPQESVLSERETEILLLICQGFSTQEIAERLFISKRTVDKHRANILEKTGCRNTASLVSYAIRNSLAGI